MDWFKKILLILYYTPAILRTSWKYQRGVYTPFSKESDLFLRIVIGAHRDEIDVDKDFIAAALQEVRFRERVIYDNRATHQH